MHMTQTSCPPASIEAAAPRADLDHDAGPGPRADLLTSLRPLAIDIGVPLGSFYLLHDVFGVSLWLSLALSSVPAALRTMAGFAAERKANLLALLMLTVNLAGIVVSFLSGDPRAMIAKDSLISSVIAISILTSVTAPPAHVRRAQAVHDQGQAGADRGLGPAVRRIQALPPAGAGVQHDLGCDAAG